MKPDMYEVVDEPEELESGEFFLNRYRAICPDVKILPRGLPQAIRVNTTKVSHEKLLASLEKRGTVVEKISWLKNAYYAKAEFSLGATPEYLLGWYYLQAPLSQLTCEVFDLPAHATVLDMAAAPGGKTTYLAQLASRGMVVALDSNPDRMVAVRNNVERLGLVNVVCVKKDARFAGDLKMQFSHVLLDAPCSGNFCSEDGWFGKRVIGDIKANARVQRELFKAALRCLAPGGRMVYSTCSLEPEEDECVISWILEKHPELTVVPLDHLPIGDAGTTTWAGETLDPRVAGTRRFWPHKTGCEGFFIALLEKK